MTWLYNAAEYLVSFLECYILICAFGLFFEKRYKKYAHIALGAVCSVAVMVITTLLNTLALLSYFTVAIWVLLLAGISMVLYKSNYIKALSVAVVYMIVISAFDFFVISVIELILGVEGFTLSIISEVGLYRTIYILFQKTVLVIAYAVIPKKRLYSFSMKTSVALIASGIFCFFCMQYLINAIVIGDIIEIKKSVLVAWLFMMSFFISLVLILKTYTQFETEKLENSIINTRVTTLETNILQQNQTYKDIAKISHDYKNQLKTISSLEERKQYNELSTYLKELVQDTKHDKWVSYTGVEIVDAVLNNKMYQVEGTNINIDINASYPANSSIRGADICAVLVNVIDNAIEACEKLDDNTEKSININIANVNSMVVIKVENPIPLQNDSVNTDIGITTKTDKNIHGYGMKIIDSIVAKYQGTFERQKDNGSYKAIIILYY